MNSKSAMCGARTLRLDKNRVGRSFAASCATYEKCASVQCALADTLVERVAAHGKSWNRGLEIGCGTGYLSRKLVEKVAIQELYLNDLAPELCSCAADRIVPKRDLLIHELTGDIEAIELPHTLDLVVSSSSLQWIEDMEALFAKIADALAVDGLFAFSLFGTGTMREISQLSGRSLMYRDFATLKRITAKYFTIEESGSQDEVLYFPSILALFRHIRNTGVGGLGQTQWTREKLKDFEQKYRQFFGRERGLPVSYSAHFFLVRNQKSA